MSETNRRKFLAVAGTGAAAGRRHHRRPGARAGPDAAAARRQTVVAVVADHRRHVALMVGEREVVVHDRDLVDPILNAAGGE